MFKMLSAAATLLVPRPSPPRPHITLPRFPNKITQRNLERLHRVPPSAFFPVLRQFPLGVARQSLESRLADAAAASSSLAAAAHRGSAENIQNSPATSLSPFTQSSTTVRRTSTSRYSVNGEVGDSARG